MCAHVACVTVVVVVGLFLWCAGPMTTEASLAGWLLSALGSFETPRQEILPMIAAVNWPIFLERGSRKEFCEILCFSCTHGDTLNTNREVWRDHGGGDRERLGAMKNRSFGTTFKREF